MQPNHVSIIINNYNYADYLPTAIESALAQTWPDTEIIVVDDGSTDESRRVIAGFGTRIRAVLQENQGQHAAFNAGFAASRGDIVLFLDSDDALLPEAAAKVAAAWRAGLSKVQFCLASVDREGRFLGSIFPTYPDGLSPARIRDEVLRTALYPCPPTSGNAYARTYLERVMPLARMLPGADGPLNTTAPLYGDVLTIDRALGYYRVHDRNMGAQHELSTDKFIRYIRHDLQRSDFLRKHARHLGFVVPEDPLDRAILHLQYRLASIRLMPERHPIEGETVAGITFRAFKALFWLEDHRLSRFVLLVWFGSVALLPRPLARRLITWRFVPERRSGRMTWLLRRFRVLRRTDDALTEKILDLPAPVAMPLSTPFSSDKPKF
jgi:hypothetical protein